MYIDTGDFASLKKLIFKEGNIGSIDDLKDHANYEILDHVHFFDSIDKVISSADEKDKAYFINLKETFECYRSYKESRDLIAKLTEERDVISAEQGECDKVKTDAMVRSVYRFAGLHKRMTAYDTPMVAMVKATVFAVILAALFFIVWMRGSSSMGALPYPMLAIAVIWFIGFFNAARKLGPYSDACTKENELASKYRELTSRINEQEDISDKIRKEAFLSYKELKSLEHHG